MGIRGKYVVRLGAESHTENLQKDILMAIFVSDKREGKESLQLYSIFWWPLELKLNDIKNVLNHK